jgi:hypothetical protein
MNCRTRTLRKLALAVASLLLRMVDRLLAHATVGTTPAPADTSREEWIRVSCRIANWPQAAAEEMDCPRCGTGTGRSAVC